MTSKPENQQAGKRTFFELLEAYRKTAVEQSKITGTSMNECGMALCGGDILDDLADEMHNTARAEGFAEGVEDATADLALVQDAETLARGRAEGAEQERMRIWMLRDMVSQNPNDTVILVPVKALMLPASVLSPAPKESEK